MKKLLIIFLFLLGGILCWGLCPEYGSGYSEEQRRLWNERRALYPVEWMMSSRFPNREFHTDLAYEINDLIGRDSNAAKLLIEEKDKLEKGLDGELQQNRDREGWEYRVKSPLWGGDSAHLPLEGLTEKEVAERALAGDGDACLEMVQYLCGDYYGFVSMGVDRLSWREYHEVERWLDWAITLKRPGSEFLKNLFHEEVNRQRNLVQPNGIIGLVSSSNMEKVPGYTDYLECLRKGDVRLYKTVIAIFPESRTKNYQMIREILWKEANKGKKDAQRKYASLCFESILFKQAYFVRSSIARDVQDRIDGFEKLLQVFPSAWRSSVISGLFSCGILDAERTRTMDLYREAADCARKAARQGDLVGMYLWMRYGIKSLKRFSKEDWKEIFAYDCILFEAGYAPYLQDQYMETLSEAVMRSCYSEKSYWKIRRTDYLADRGIMYKRQNNIDGEVISKDDLDQTRIKVANRRLTGQTDYLLGCLKRWQADGTFLQAGKEIRSYLLEQVENWAGEGDLFAMYVLAEFYEEGRFIGFNPGRAYGLYEKIFEKAGVCSLSLVPVSKGEYANDKGMGTAPLKYAALLGMAEMVLKYPEFLGRNEKRVYEWLVDFISLNTYFYHSNYLLGQFYERGTGCVADREKALKLYKNASFSSEACRKAEERLSSVLEGEGKIQKEKD